jgi:hypothetical protein
MLSDIRISSGQLLYALIKRIKSRWKEKQPILFVEIKINKREKHIKGHFHIQRPGKRDDSSVAERWVVIVQENKIQGLVYSRKWNAGKNV